jgi:hypothetical protein
MSGEFLRRNSRPSELSRQRHGLIIRFGNNDHRNFDCHHRNFNYYHRNLDCHYRNFSCHHRNHAHLNGDCQNLTELTVTGSQGFLDGFDDKSKLKSRIHGADLLKQISSRRFHRYGQSSQPLSRK